MSIREATSLLAERVVEGDKRDACVTALTALMATMTERVEQYGRMSVKLATASLLVAVIGLVVTVVVAVVG